MSDFNEIHPISSLSLSRYKPYVNPDLQLLSSFCCILLVTMSSVLLRSQSLLSSARFINFDPSNPVEAAETQTVDVNYTIIILIGCIFTPFAVALKLHHVLLACFTLLKKRWTQRKQHGHLFPGVLSATTCNVTLQNETQAASFSEDMSTVHFSKIVADAPSVTYQSASGIVFSAQDPQHHVDAIVPERFGGMKFTQSEVSVEHLCDPVDIDLTEYNDCGNDASSIRTIFFRRAKSFQVHQNRAVHLGDTISSPL